MCYSLLFEYKKRRTRVQQVYMVKVKLKEINLSTYPLVLNKYSNRNHIEWNPPKHTQETDNKIGMNEEKSIT